MYIITCITHDSVACPALLGRVTHYSESWCCHLVENYTRISLKLGCKLSNYLPTLLMTVYTNYIFHKCYQQLVNIITASHRHLNVINHSQTMHLWASCDRSQMGYSSRFTYIITNILSFLCIMLHYTYVCTYIHTYIRTYIYIICLLGSVNTYVKYVYK